MLTLVSRLSCILIGIAAVASAAPRAAGLYDDPFSVLSRPDTGRISIRASQTELERDGFRASALTIGARIRTGARAHVECAAQFPAIRRAGDVRYGLGDGFVAGSYRVAGDSLETSALLLRCEARIPTGGKGLAPFCWSSLDGGAGIEARAAAGSLSMRGFAAYTLAGSRARDDDFVNEHHATLAASIALAVPRIGSATASFSWTRYRGGVSQETAAVGFERDLSTPVAVGALLAVQSADGSDELYEWLLGLSITYRFPARVAAPPSPDGPLPGTPPPGAAGDTP